MHLHLVRHAKSSWKDASLADFDRPLNKRGRDDLPRIGKHLRRKKIHPDWLLASDSVRTRETANALAKHLKVQPEAVHLDHRLYLANWEALLAVIRETPLKCRALMVVGHNPGITELAQQLGGARCIDDELPTGAVVSFDIAFGDWQSVAPGSGALLEVVLPKTLH